VLLGFVGKSRLIVPQYRLTLAMAVQTCCASTARLLAMKDAGLESVDLWIGSGGQTVAQLMLPVLKPKAYLPVHWDGLYSPFWGGVPSRYSDPMLEALLRTSGVTLVRPGQYMDKWRLDRAGIHAVDNSAIKRALGFSDPIAK